MASTEEAVKHYRWRYGLMLFVLAAAASVMCGRAVYLHVVQHDFWYEQGEARNLRVEPLAAHRGVIQDRNGAPLAVSSPVVSIWINPGQLIKEKDRWAVLAKSADISFDKLQDKVTRYQNKSFVYLKRHLSPVVAAKVLDLNVAGVYGMTEYRRYYPAGEVAGHIVGFTNVDEEGQEGLELAYEKHLKSESGKKRVIKDLLGRVIQDVELIESAKPGNDLMLSIDLRMQYLAYRELLSAVKKHSASSGSVVVLDVKTGEVLAMVNQPSYNPNNRAGLNVAAVRNRAVTDVFEPGSTMKPITVAAALESKKFTVSSMIDTRPGNFKVGKKLIEDHRDYGVIDVPTVLQKSSNVGATKLALALDEGALPVMMQRVGFGQSTGSGFPGESVGVMPYRSNWRPIELATLSYGYGLSVTTLQLAQSYGVIANGGVKMPVTMLKQETLAEGEQVLDKAVADSLLPMLAGVVSAEGTASRAGVEGYVVGGKTGTAHKVTASGYAEDRYVSIFVGVAPIDNPRIVVAVMVDDPKGEDYFGGLVAAPIFSNIVGGVLRAMNVPPEVNDDTQIEISMKKAAGGNA